jgi:predicted ATPase
MGLVMVGTIGAMPLQGRESETALLASLIDGVGSKGASLVLRGEPGIAKSRLLREAITLAEGRNMTVVSTSGVQAEARLPFAGLHQLLRPVRDRAINLMPQQRLALDAAFGLEVGEEPAQFRIALATLDVLCDVAAASLLVAVEDAHWLDRATAEVLAFVARRLEADPIVLLVATRDGYDSPLTEAGLPEHRLAPLDSVAARAVVDAVSPRLSVSLRETILRQPAGNPLALNELPLTAARDDTGAPPGVLPLTERLERVFTARLADLPEQTHLSLLIAALNDRDGTREVLDAAALAAGQRIDLDALEPAARAGLIELDVRSVRFRHPLMRSAVRQAVPLERRRRAHEALAEALSDDPDRRVWHRAALISGPHEEIAAELEDAGRRARRRGAISVAGTALRRAVELSALAQRARRLVAAAEVAFELGQLDIVASLVREVELLEPGPLERARAAWIDEMISLRAPSRTWATALIALAEQAGQAGDHDLHFALLWLVATRFWWADPAPRRDGL